MDFTRVDRLLRRNVPDLDVVAGRSEDAVGGGVPEDVPRLAPVSVELGYGLEIGDVRLSTPCVAEELLVDSSDGDSSVLAGGGYERIVERAPGGIEDRRGVGAAQGKEVGELYRFRASQCELTGMAQGR